MKHFKDEIVETVEPAPTPAAELPEVIEPLPVPAPVEVFPFVEPAPARFTKEARAEWPKVHPVMRAAILKLHDELDAEFKVVKAAAMRDASMAEWWDMAEAGGKYLPDVIAAYIETENLLRVDIVAGCKAIADNMGLDFEKFCKDYLARDAA